MYTSFSIDTSRKITKVPYSLGAGWINARGGYEGNKIIYEGAKFPAEGQMVIRGIPRVKGHMIATVVETDDTKGRFAEIAKIEIPYNPSVMDRDPAYPFIFTADFPNPYLAHVTVSDGMNGQVLAQKSIYIRRDQPVEKAREHNVIGCEGLPIKESNDGYIQHSIGFIRCRSNTKDGEKYGNVEFLPTGPHFEQILQKGTNYGVQYEDVTHADKGDGNTPILELAEYIEDEQAMQVLGQIRLEHLTYTDDAATSKKGLLTVGLDIYYEDPNTLLITVYEKSGFRKFKTTYIFDITREVLVQQRSNPEPHPEPVAPKVAEPVVPKTTTAAGSKPVSQASKVSNSDKQAEAIRRRKEIELKNAINEINGLVGLEEVKKKIQGICTHIEYDRVRAEKLGVEPPMECPRFMFTGNPGTGKTTVARKLAAIYKNAGLLSKGQLIEVDRKDLVASYIGETAKQTHKICETAYGGVLFIDEAYELANGDKKDFGKEAIATLLTEMENRRKDFIVVFAGYTDEMEELLNTNSGLKSRITDIIEFPDYTEKELCAIATKIAAESKYTLTEDGIKAFEIAIGKKKVDRKFGNAREVRNILQDAMQKRGERYMQDQSLSLTELTAEDFGIDLREDVQKTAKELLAELDSMVGLASVKKDVRNITNRAKYIMKEIDAGTMSPEGIDMNMNLCFTGNPGTGKTTVARLYAQILHAIGLTKTDKFVESSREDFVAGYSGQTATKTKEICEKAYGGVLFIDEAYSLVQGDNDSFGKEALATLIKEMEDNRDKLVVIMAGYTKEMNEFMNFNSGVKSRISKYIEFEDYSAEELQVIFDKLVMKNNVTLDFEAEMKAKEVIEAMVANKDRNFGNAREIRNLFEEVWSNMISRVEDQELTGADRRIITATDF